MKVEGMGWVSGLHLTATPSDLDQRERDEKKNENWVLQGLLEAKKETIQRGILKKGRGLDIYRGWKDHYLLNRLLIVQNMS
jgi:hypothetical protein